MLIIWLKRLLANLIKSIINYSTEITVPNTSEYYLEDIVKLNGLD